MDDKKRVGGAGIVVLNVIKQTSKGKKKNCGQGRLGTPARGRFKVSIVRTARGPTPQMKKDAKRSQTRARK